MLRPYHSFGTISRGSKPMIASNDCITRLVARGVISISPFDVSLLKLGSYTFRLDKAFRRLRPSIKPIDFRISKPEYEAVLAGDEGFILEPGAFVLGQTLEHLKLKRGVACLLSARGTCAQAGLNVLLSSQYAEPGTDQKLVLEIFNASPSPMALYPGMPIVKGIFSDVGELEVGLPLRSVAL